MTLRTDELDRIVADVRERFGSRLPPRPLPGEVEHSEQRRAREERTTWVLEHEVLVEVNRERIDTGARAFTDDDIDAVIQRVLDGIFAVEKLADAMRDAGVENVMVKGAGPVRVEFASGRIEYRPPIAATDADLLAIIRDQALAGDRPFSYRVPYVDLQLPDGSRFHAEGFDIVDAPVVTIRRPRLVEVDLDELVGYGSIDPVLSDVLTRAVRAGMVVVVSGLMNSGNPILTFGRRSDGASRRRCIVAEHRHPDQHRSPAAPLHVPSPSCRRGEGGRTRAVPEPHPCIRWRRARPDACARRIASHGHRAAERRDIPVIPGALEGPECSAASPVRGGVESGDIGRLLSGYTGDRRRFPLILR